MAAQNMITPAEAAELANTVRVSLKEAFEKLQDEKALAAWEALSNSGSDLFGYGDILADFDLEELKSDLFTMEAVVSLFARRMAELDRK